MESGSSTDLNNHATVSTGKEYDDFFEPKAYLGSRFESVSEHHAGILNCLHQFYQTVPTGVKILDIGTGPIISYMISAASKASEIVLAEYTQKNRDELQLWINGDPGAHDWDQYFRHIVQELEGKDNHAVVERKQKLRQVIKAVVPCDITADPPIEDEFKGPYDVVLSSLCLEAACSSEKEYIAAVERLWKLLKKGGRLLLQSVEAPTKTHYYIVGKQKFAVLSAPPNLVREALVNAGFDGIKIVPLPKSTNVCNESSGTMYYVSATK